MATIVKTAAAHWKSVIRRSGWPTRAKTFRLKRDAVDWARHTEDEMVRGTYIHRPALAKLLFSEAMARYLREITPTKRPSTQIGDHYRSAILLVFFGSYSLSSITPELVAQFRDQRLATRKQRNYRSPEDLPYLLCPATVRLELTLLSHLFTVAMCEWRVGLIRNPVTTVRKPSPGEGRKRRLGSTEESLLADTFATYPNPMLGWIFRIALETAMRAGEIRTLRLGQISLARRVILLTDTKNGCVRTVPLSQRATETLRLAVANPQRPDNCDYVFFGQPNAAGKCNPYRFQHTWWRTQNRLGLKTLRFHDLRHEAISRLVEAGLSDLEVASISGHKAMQMLKRYTHLRAEDLVKKFDRLGYSTSKPRATRPCTKLVPLDGAALPS